MCDNLDNYPKSDTIYEKFLQRLGEKDSIKCKKCEINSGFVLLQRKDVFCVQCFDDYCSHKFRSTIGKSKAVRRGDRILIAFSGGINSSAIIQLIMDGLNDDQHKRLKFIPSVLHIDESILRKDLTEEEEEEESTIKEITEMMSKTDWNCFVSSIEMSYRESDDNFYTNLNQKPIERQTDCRKAFMNSFSNIKSLTSKQEFVKRIRYRLICDIAKTEKFDKIFVANNASNLAIGLMSDVAVGKGNQLNFESGFIDDRNEVPVLRPMREFTAKESTFYAVMKKLKFIVRKDLSTNTAIKSSIQRMTEAFVNGLQSEFPSTVYTIFKTGNKLESFVTKSHQKCILCNCSIDTSDRPKCSAFEALNLTQNLSNNSNFDSETNSECNDSNGFTSTSTQLCYSCCLISKEMTGIDDKFPKVLRKKVDIRDVKDFIIDYNENDI